MDQKDKKEIVVLMCEALDELVIPRLENIEDRLDNIEGTLKEHTEILDLHTSQLEGINRRLDLEADKRGEIEVRINNHEKRLTKVEAKVA